MDKFTKVEGGTNRVLTQEVRFTTKRKKGTEQGHRWRKDSALGLTGYNGISQGIAFIGNYETIDRPDDAQIEQLVMLLRNGTDSGKLDQNYKLYGALQVKATLSPGKFLMEKLTQLPHFTLEKPPAAAFG